MGAISQFTTLVVTIMIPGIVAAFIFEKLTSHAKWSYFNFAVHAVLFGWFSYFPLYFVSRFSKTIKFQVIEVPLNHLERIDKAIYSEILWACLVAVMLSFILSWSANKKYLNRFARLFHISNKYGDENLFAYALNNAEIDWIYVRRAAAGLIYRGQIRHYSDENGLQEMILADADIYDYTDSAHLYHIDGIYLCGQPGDFTIELASDIKGADNHKLAKAREAYRKAQVRAAGGKRYKQLSIRPKECIAPPPALRKTAAAKSDKKQQRPEKAS